MTVNKQEMVNQLVERANLSKTDANAAVDAMIQTTTDALKNGDSVRLAGFGTFSVSHRQATTSRNPQTGDRVDVPARNVPRFKASKNLTEALN